MSLTPSQWYNDFDKTFHEKTGFHLSDQEAQFYLFYQDPATKQTMPMSNLVGETTGRDYARTVMNTYSAGARFYVMNNDGTEASRLWIDPETNTNAFLDRVEKPSRMHRFLNIITLGKAYKQEIASYKEQVAIDKTAQSYKGDFLQGVEQLEQKRQKEQAEERARIQAKENRLKQQIAKTLESGKSQKSYSDSMIEQLFSPTAKVSDDLRNITYASKNGAEVAEEIRKVMNTIEEIPYSTVDGIDKKISQTIAIGAAMLNSSIDKVQVSNSTASYLDPYPKVNFQKNQRTMLIENTIAPRIVDTIRNLGVYQMIASGREYTANAMEEYRKGNVAPVADALRQVVETCTETWNSATLMTFHGNSLHVSAQLLTNALEFIEQNPEVQKATGLSKEQLSQAKGISGMEQVYQEGQKAISQLVQGNLTQEEREALTKKALGSALICNTWKQGVSQVFSEIEEGVGSIYDYNGVERDDTDRLISISMAQMGRAPLDIERLVAMDLPGTIRRFEAQAVEHPLYKDLLDDQKAMSTLEDVRGLIHPKLQREQTTLNDMNRIARNVTIQYVRTSQKEQAKQLETTKGKDGM